jgi:hypothetical protein
MHRWAFFLILLAGIVLSQPPAWSQPPGWFGTPRWTHLYCQCPCPDNYAAKPCPRWCMLSEGTCDDYCGKCMPRVPALPCGLVDDYRPKCLPRQLPCLVGSQYTCGMPANPTSCGASRR